VTFDDRGEGWRRPTTGCLTVLGHFSQKSPIINGSFTKGDLQLEASYSSLPPCKQQQQLNLLCIPMVNGCRSAVEVVDPTVANTISQTKAGSSI